MKFKDGKMNSYSFDASKKNFYERLKTRKTELEDELQKAQEMDFDNFNTWEQANSEYRFLKDVLGPIYYSGIPQWDYNSLLHLPKIKWTDSDGDEHIHALIGTHTPGYYGFLGLGNVLSTDESINIIRRTPNEEGTDGDIIDLSVNQDVIQGSLKNVSGYGAEKSLSTDTEGNIVWDEGSGQWGKIKGTITDQEDLQNALAAKENLVHYGEQPKNPEEYDLWAVEGGEGWEPENFIKSITKDGNQSITWENKDGTTETFQPESTAVTKYLEDADKDGNRLILTKIKDGVTETFEYEPTVEGGVTKEYVDNLVATEASARETGETSLSDGIKQEITDRQLADTALQNNINTLDDTVTQVRTDLNNEVTRATNAEAGKVSIMEGSGAYCNIVDGEETTQQIVAVSNDVSGDAIVQRYGEQIKVPLVQNNDYEAASKAYVDSHSAEGIINDTAASASSTYSSNKINTLVSGIVNIDVVTEQPTSPADNTMYYIGTENPYTVKLHTTGDNWYEMGSTTIDLTPYFKTANIANNLTTTTSGKALDARQGKVLNDSIGTLSSTVGSFEKSIATAQSTATEAKAGLTNGTVSKVGTATVGATLKPIYLNAGVPTAGTQLYNKNMTVNGTAYSHIRTANNNSFSIYAPTAAGSQGQVLTSYGSGAPKWNSMFSNIKADSGAISAKGVYKFSESLKHFDMLCIVYKLADADIYGVAWFPVFDLFTDANRVWEISHGYDDDDHNIRLQFTETTFSITYNDEMSLRGIYGMFRCADKA